MCQHILDEVPFKKNSSENYEEYSKIYIFKFQKVFQLNPASDIEKIRHRSLFKLTCAKYDILNFINHGKLKQ
jgi:hypothetical protein